MPAQRSPLSPLPAHAVRLTFQSKIQDPKSKISPFSLDISGSFITRLYLPNEQPADALPLPAEPTTEEEKLAARAFAQLQEYQRGTRRTFDLPLQLPAGMTPFQRRIMAAMLAIPYGETRTYAQLGPARAVGTVCARNPLPLFYPCHRVLPAHPPKLHPHGHYRGGEPMKAALLEMERSLD